MAYKFQFGAARMSGSLTQEEGITVVAGGATVTAGGLTVTAGTSALQATTCTTLSATGDVDLGNATSDTITATGQFDSDLVPSSDSARDLGTSALQWAEAHIDTGYIDAITVTGTSTLTTVDINGGNIDGTTIGAASVAAGSFAAVVGTTGVYSGILKTDDTTEATSTTDGSLQTDGGLSVAKSVVIGDDLDLLSDGAIMNIGSTSKFTLTDQSANNCVMAASGARLAFGNAGEYITGDGTDLKIVSSNDIDVTGDLDVVGSVTSTLISALASASGTTTIGSATKAVFTAAGLLHINNTTEATSATDGSLQTDGGLSVVKSAVVGDDLDLLSDAAIMSFGADKDVSLTHVADTGLLLNSTMAIQFNDASQYIKASSAADLDIAATTDVNIDCTTLDVNAAANVSGLLTIQDDLVPAASDGSALGTISLQFSDLFLAEGGVINWDNGDMTMTQVANVLTVAGGTVTATLTNSIGKAANSGLGGTTYDGSAAVADWKLDMNTLTAAAVDVATDSISIIDSSDSNQSRKESIADLVSAMAGTGLSAASGQLSVGASSTPNAIGDADATLAEGLNYGNATFTAARTWTMLASSNLSTGDVVRIKAPLGVSTSNTLTIARAGTQTFDGETSLVIESPYGAVSLFYVAANTFVVL
jgi:hypothetical protein